MTLSTDNFDIVRRLLEQQTGIVLESDQRLFTEGRLIPLAQRHGWNGFDPLVSHLKNRDNRLLEQEVIEALTIHETSFFRDAHYFDELTETILPGLIARRADTRRLNIWCAACSTGQEAYSVAILLRERFEAQLRDWTVDLIASDLSSKALEQARLGHYSEVEVNRGLSAARLAQHFRKHQTGWRIDDRLKRMVQFHQVNLTATWPRWAAIDLVLLRNVLIYMTPTARQSILGRVEKILAPDGKLVLGSTESSFVECGKSPKHWPSWEN